jgi:hypothetical protein
MPVHAGMVRFFNKGLRMPVNPKIHIVAKVETNKVKYQKPEKLGIDFANEIDIWSKMEFKSRQQVKLLREKGCLDGHNILQDLNTLVYAVREKIEID